MVILSLAYPGQNGRFYYGAIMFRDHVYAVPSAHYFSDNHFLFEDRWN